MSAKSTSLGFSSNSNQRFVCGHSCARRGGCRFIICTIGPSHVHLSLRDSTGFSAGAGHKSSGELQPDLRNQLQGPLRLSDAEPVNLAEVGKRLGRKVMAEVAQIVRPETILAWHRKLVARKFDGYRRRSNSGRPSTAREVEELALDLARANRSWRPPEFLDHTS
jgi:hypothetical protein